MTPFALETDAEASAGEGVPGPGVAPAAVGEGAGTGAPVAPVASYKGASDACGIFVNCANRNECHQTTRALP